MCGTIEKHKEHCKKDLLKNSYEEGQSSLGMNRPPERMAPGVGLRTGGRLLVLVVLGQAVVCLALACPQRDAWSGILRIEDGQRLAGRRIDRSVVASQADTAPRVCPETVTVPRVREIVGHGPQTSCSDSVEAYSYERLKVRRASTSPCYTQYQR